MHPSFIPVVSSNIQGYYYAVDKQELLIAFTRDTYSYDAVPANVVADFANAPSKGKFFGANIKTAYVTTKLDDDQVAAIVARSIPAPPPQPRRKAAVVPFHQLVTRNPWLQDAIL